MTILTFPLKGEIMNEKDEKLVEPKPLEANQMEVIEQLKQKLDKSVPQEEYQKAIEENKKLLNDMVNRRPAPKVEELKAAREYAKELTHASHMTNRKFIETSVNYREAMIAETGRDPWSDNGEQTSETVKVAETFKALLAEHPDDFGFRSKLHSVMRDDANLLAKLRGTKRK